MQIHNLETDEVFEDSADILMTGTGLLNEWKWPSIPGLHDFNGPLLHSASWDETFDSKVGSFIGFQIYIPLYPTSCRI